MNVNYNFLGFWFFIVELFYIIELLNMGQLNEAYENHFFSLKARLGKKSTKLTWYWLKIANLSGSNS